MSISTDVRYESTTTDLLLAARSGDRSAWEQIVKRYARLVRSIAAEFRLQESDAADVAQNTWLRLLAYGGTIRDPEKLGSWLATTARREASAFLRRSRPEVAIGVGGRRGRGRGSLPRRRRRRRRDGRRGPASRRRAQRSAAAPRERAVLPVARISYDEVSRRTGLPVGSIGPTRIRTLKRLHRTLVEWNSPHDRGRLARRTPAYGVRMPA